MRRVVVEDDGNMDSLLDTMMNVVGILIIVLVVTQLGVGDAVKRIGKTAAVDPAALLEAKARLVTYDRQRDKLKAIAQDLQQGDQQITAQRLNELLEKNAERQKELDQLSSQLKARQEKLVSDKKLLAETQEQIREDKELLEKLRKEILAAQEEEARLKAILAKTRPRKTLPPIEIALPNPRPAPEGAKQILFICCHGKLYPLHPLDIERFRTEGQTIGLSVIQSKQLELHLPVDGKQKTYYIKDHELFLREFNRHLPNDPYFRIELVASGSTPRLVFHPLEKGGETRRTINRSQSRFRKQLKSVNALSYYIRFQVCADSFDVYVIARRIISRIDLLAGWEPQTTTWRYATSLGGPIRFGPPPKPKPKPTTPKPPPAKPAKPPNVID